MLKLACSIDRSSIGRSRGSAAGSVRQVRPEPVEAPFPACTTLMDPALGRLECGDLDRGGPNPADLFGADEAAVLQQLQVLEHGRERHRQRPCEIAHRGRALRKPVDDRPAARVGKRVKDEVERRILLKHLLKYSPSPRRPGTDQPTAEGAQPCHSPASNSSPSRSTVSPPAKVRASTPRSVTPANDCTSGCSSPGGGTKG